MSMESLIVNGHLTLYLFEAFRNTVSTWSVPAASLCPKRVWKWSSHWRKVTTNAPVQKYCAIIKQETLSVLGLLRFWQKVTSLFSRFSFFFFYFRCLISLSLHIKKNQTIAFCITFFINYNQGNIKAPLASSISSLLISLFLIFFKS